MTLQAQGTTLNLLKRVKTGGKVKAVPRFAVKQRNAARTKEAILAAAEVGFSTLGYTHIGVRELAAAAGVDRALIVRYFGSKQGLFEAVLDRTLRMDFFQFERATFGRDLADYFLSQAPNSPAPVRMMVLAAADPTARKISMRLEQDLVIKPLAKFFGPPDAYARATNLIMLWSGFFVFRRLELPILRKVDPAIRLWMESASQAIADGRLIDR